MPAVQSEHARADGESRHESLFFQKAGPKLLLMYSVLMFVSASTPASFSMRL